MFDMEGVDPLEGREPQTPTPLGKTHSGSLKRFLTLRRTKNKPRPEICISGPYALAPSPPAPPAESHLSLGAPPSAPFKSRASSASSASFLLQGNAGVIPSSPNGGTDTGLPTPKYKPKKSSSLIGPGELGVLPDHGRFLSASPSPAPSSRFYSHPARPKAPSLKAASLTGAGSVGLLASEPVLHALPSMESFRSERSAKGSARSTRNSARFRDWLGRIGIGVAA